MSGAARPLELSPEEMRRVGYRVVDLLVDHFERLPTKTVTNRADRPTLERALREPMPERGRPVADVLDRLEHTVFANIMHLDHPRFFAWVPSPSNYVGAMADALASGLNIFAGTWIEASGPAQIELVTIDWLRELCGLPPEGGGLFVSGGSVAAVTALAVARHARLDDDVTGAVVYGSDQVHASNLRALRLLGLKPEQFRALPSDHGFRLDRSNVEAAVREDRRRGRRPWCVIANAGTTNTGSVDPLRQLAAYCRDEGLWLHVDGAYGAGALFSAEGRKTLGGIDEADSIAVDPHKWLFQPYEIGAVLVRDRAGLRRTFRMQPEYLQDVVGDDAEVNWSEYGIQLTRSFRALKLWMTLQVFGREGFEQAVERGIRLAEYAERGVAARAEWEVVAPAQLGVVVFRYEPVGAPASEVDALNERLVPSLIDEGSAMISSTRLRGRTALRMCTINPRTTDADIDGTLETLDRLGNRLAREAR